MKPFYIIRYRSLFMKRPVLSNIFLSSNHFRFKFELFYWSEQLTDFIISCSLLVSASCAYLTTRFIEIAGFIYPSFLYILSLILKDSLTFSTVNRSRAYYINSDRSITLSNGFIYIAKIK